jgi:hypothetical protein
MKWEFSQIRRYGECRHAQGERVDREREHAREFQRSRPRADRGLAHGPNDGVARRRLSAAIEQKAYGNAGEHADAGILAHQVDARHDRPRHREFDPAPACEQRGDAEYG